jgi:hypothetical protein
LKDPSLKYIAILLFVLRLTMQENMQSPQAGASGVDRPGSAADARTHRAEGDPTPVSSTGQTGAQSVDTTTADHHSAPLDLAQYRDAAPSDSAAGAQMESDGIQRAPLNGATSATYRAAPCGKFIVQTTLATIVLAFCILQLWMNPLSEDRTVYIALISGVVGWLLPNPNYNALKSGASTLPSSNTTGPTPPLPPLRPEEKKETEAEKVVGFLPSLLLSIWGLHGLAE